MELEEKNISEMKTYFGYFPFKNIQKEIITNLMKGNCCFVLLQTGGSKSLCSQLPALLLDGTAVINSSLIALIKNQVEKIRGYITEKAITHFINSFLTKEKSKSVKEDFFRKNKNK